MIRPPIELIVALERECLTVDKAIAGRNWAACEASWRAQRVLTHELDISLRERTLTPEESAAVQRRIARLTKYRDGQLKRLIDFNKACAKRLTTIGRFRSFSKTVNQERRASLLDVTQ
jgi:hypothetical protein